MGQSNNKQNEIAEQYCQYTISNRDITQQFKPTTAKHSTRRTRTHHFTNSVTGERRCDLNMIFTFNIDTIVVVNSRETVNWMTCFEYDHSMHYVALVGDKIFVFTEERNFYCGGGTFMRRIPLFNLSRYISTPVCIVPISHSWLAIANKNSGEIVIVNWRNSEFELKIPDEFGIVNNDVPSEKLMLCFGNYLVVCYSQYIVMYEISLANYRISKITWICYLKTESTGIEPLFNSQILLVICKSEILYWNLRKKTYKRSSIIVELNETILDVAQLDVKQLVVVSLASNNICSIRIWDMSADNCISQQLYDWNDSIIYRVYPLSSDIVMLVDGSRRMRIKSLSSKQIDYITNGSSSFTIFPNFRHVLLSTTERCNIFDYPNFSNFTFSLQKNLFEGIHPFRNYVDIMIQCSITTITSIA
jgi:hypothetical protein